MQEVLIHADASPKWNKYNPNRSNREGIDWYMEQSHDAQKQWYHYTWKWASFINVPGGVYKREGVYLMETFE